nr:pyridoxal-phosphate dependent enzyme [Legionella jordanis]
MQPLHIKTALTQSQLLTNRFGKIVYFKNELLQPSGSFKLRGIGKLCQSEWQRGVRSFVASSGGNAGVAVAYCGMKLKVPTKVFIPSTSHPIYIEAIKAFGAQVVVAGGAWDEAHRAAQNFAEEKQAAYIPPFDHPLLWQGHATMMTELVSQGMPKPDAVIASVGGGGLACGVLEGMRQCKWQDVPLIAVETRGADSFFQSLKANQLIRLPVITSKATSLGAKCISAQLMRWEKEHDVRSLVVSDEDADYGSRAFAKDQRMLVELASGASLAPVYQNHPIIQSFKTILVIVCGGLNISHFDLNHS